MSRTGLEPATNGLKVRYASIAPPALGTPDGTQTHNLRIRNPALFPLSYRGSSPGGTRTHIERLRRPLLVQLSHEGLRRRERESNSQGPFGLDGFLNRCRRQSACLSESAGGRNRTGALRVFSAARLPTELPWREGGPDRTRTCNLAVKSRLHLQLCYKPLSAAAGSRTQTPSRARLFESRVSAKFHHSGIYDDIWPPYPNGVNVLALEASRYGGRTP